MPMVFTRGRTAKKRLKVDWDVPVFQASEVDVQQTAVPAGKMDQAAVLAYLRGKDRRPLLVMRECRACAGTDWALLSKSLNNDRTMLLTHWFHCVRLPSSVTRKSHPFHAVFAGKNPPHLFFTTRDGKELLNLPGDQTQSVVWKTMTSILRKSYRKDPNKALKKLLHVLDEFDTLDSAEGSLRRRLDAAIEAHGPKSSKFKSLRAQFTALQKKRKALVARERKLRNLAIK